MTKTPNATTHRNAPLLPQLGAARTRVTPSRRRLGRARIGAGVFGTALGLGLALGGYFVGERGALPESDYARGVSRAFESVSARIAPSVVRIEALQRFRGGLQPIGQGSGFVLTSDGLIVTNAHVVRGSDAQRLTLLDGRQFLADLVGKDSESDLALLRIDAKDLTPAPLRTDAPARVGEWVVAVGNPLGLGHSVSAGIVSGRGRETGITTYEDFIQTDAAINPGNSGGPLVDLEGRVIGVNTAVADIRLGGQGIGFAIPAPMVDEIVNQLASDGRVRRGYVGINLLELSESYVDQIQYDGSSRVAVRSVVEGGPAQLAGLRKNDIVTSVDGQPVTTLKNLMARIAKVPPGTTVDVEVLRGSRARVLPVRLAERPNVDVPQR
ncbi:MAG: trypsin-like peptidase domain-containing protein [Planctomycetota bacterium]